MNFKQFLIEAPKPRYRLGPNGYEQVGGPKKRAPRRLNNPTPAYPQQEPISNLERGTVDFDPAKVGRVAKPRQRIRAGDEPVRAPRKPKVRPVGQPAEPGVPYNPGPLQPLGAGPLEPGKIEPVEEPKPNVITSPGPGPGPLRPLSPTGGPLPVETPPVPPPPYNPGPLQPLGTGPMEPEADKPAIQPGGNVDGQITDIAKAAAANHNMSQIDQLIQMALNVRNQPQSSRNGPDMFTQRKVSKRRQASTRAKQIYNNVKGGGPEYVKTILQDLSRMSQTGGH